MMSVEFLYSVMQFIQKLYKHKGLAFKIDLRKMHDLTKIICLRFVDVYPATRPNLELHQLDQKCPR